MAQGARLQGITLRRPITVSVFIIRRIMLGPRRAIFELRHKFLRFHSDLPHLDDSSVFTKKGRMRCLRLA